jgi:hypothetical protein
MRRSAFVKTAAGDASGASRVSIVSHDTRQATTQHNAMQLASKRPVLAALQGMMYRG